MDMQFNARVALIVLVAVVSSCKKEKKEEPPLEDPCSVFCQRVPECCAERGLPNCEEITDLCRAECEAMRTDNVDSDVDFDEIVECIDLRAACYQLLGVDEAQLEATYTTCVADLLDCDFVGACAEDGETRCCEGVLATCTFGTWIIHPCQQECVEAGQIYGGTCDDSSGAEACNCMSPPAACQQYCQKGIAYCEERDWQGCAEEGVESCILLMPGCEASCSGLQTDLEASGIDPDAVMMCMWRYSSPLQILGCDPTGSTKVYSDCVADVTICPESGACSTDEEGDKLCCSGALATCTGGYWLLDPCATVCRRDTPETPNWTGVCEELAGVATCECEA
jgi:hypothetical protein